MEDKHYFSQNIRLELSKRSIKLMIFFIKWIAVAVASGGLSAYQNEAISNSVNSCGIHLTNVLTLLQSLANYEKQFLEKLQQTENVQIRLSSMMGSNNFTFHQLLKFQDFGRNNS